VLIEQSVCGPQIVKTLQDALFCWCYIVYALMWHILNIIERGFTVFEWFGVHEFHEFHGILDSLDKYIGTTILILSKKLTKVI